MQQRTMEEMKHIIGHNIVALRRGAGLTQSELAERLNYSDKAVSKWECGDAVPDILILTRITEMFGVTLDWLVRGEHEINMPSPERAVERRHTVIILLSGALVWLVATVLFVALGGFVPGAHGVWVTFIAAIPVSALVVFILAIVWKRSKLKYISVSLVLWGTILSFFLSLVVFNAEFFSSPWLLFILGIPGQVFIILFSHLFPRRRAAKQGGKM